jgi:molybdopterin-guanine dinucleotide biosynthesis protein A
MGGGDKCLLKLKNHSLLERCIERASPQVEQLILNANGKVDRFQKFGLTCVPDTVADFAGPLAGVLTAMEWSKENAPQCEWVVSFASDTPFFPKNMASALMAEALNTHSLIAVAESGGRWQPVFALWHVSLAEKLRTALVDEGVRKIDHWMQRFSHCTVDFSNDELDPFFNINRPEDIEAAEQII